MPATFAIDSKEHWVDTGLTLESGRRYELVATGTWMDASISTDSDGYESVNFLQRETETLRRFAGARWFALIGALDRRKETEFVIGSRAVYEPQETGKLSCFANDLVGFYSNNEGSVTLTVTELT